MTPIMVEKDAAAVVVDPAELLELKRANRQLAAALELERDRRRRLESILRGVLEALVISDGDGWLYRTTGEAAAVPTIVRRAVERYVAGVRGAAPRDR